MTPKQKATLQRLGPFIALVLVSVGLAVLSPDFLTVANLLNVMRQVSINALIAFGMTLVILLGGIDLSVGSILALSSVAIATLIQAGVDPLLATLLGVLGGGLMGLFNGLVISKGKVAPFIATLASMTILRGLALVVSGGSPITGFNSDLFSMLGGGYVAGLVQVVS
ncbi:ABC transporter permease subunit [Aquitalea magnusonii]|uniref:ABC transporter permease subunit n=1 Tax=Aquitalea magnusonii TaxID=332411 RepID=UPI000A8EBD5B